MNKCLFILLLLQAHLNSFSQLLNTGWKSPTAIHAPYAWTDPQNAFLSDDVYATVPHQGGCRCPYIELSWNNGFNYTASKIFGPFGTSDSFHMEGDSADKWGHQWLATELGNTAFVLRILDPTTLYKQGYTSFQFGIPAGSIINGIEVWIEAHGDTNFTEDFVDLIQARVYYSAPNPVNELFAGSNFFNFYPNPAINSIHLNFGFEEEKAEMQILNVSGQVLIKKLFDHVSSGNEYIIDVAHLPPGIYFLTLNSRLQRINTRFVKK